MSLPIGITPVFHWHRLSLIEVQPFTRTAMKNRVDLPDQIHSKSLELKDDEVLAYHTNRLLALGWRAAQKKPVIMLSSEEPAKVVRSTTEKSRMSGNRRLSTTTTSH